MRSKDRTGLVGEDKAAEYLVESGHRILERRWRTPTGELDLITMDHKDLVAVEVKTRRGVGFGHPFEAITEPKLRRLHRLLIEYAAHRRLKPARKRVDAIAVLLERENVEGENSAVLEHLKDIS
ncbi:YraN family protein [Nesterenkonia haasae]|uniref:YraN family protein n=1 Tax=Nesterenkonia haasae TaxID=2587813 RepID=UPI0013917ABC|nr:YraN family protein [Nesterenkonia haasae]NDK30714.1 YraN family protein [Nesterenkonia haasae]